jgi:Nucleotidyl transferase AbiEii toxin, Type IV TA system
MGCCMFKRLHHQRIAKVLAAFDGALLARADCYFAGGTAITLALDEYRESVDIDFLCASVDGYRLVRNTVNNTLGDFLTSPIEHVRQLRADRDKVSCFLRMDGQPIKVEIVLEGRIALTGAMHATFGVPVLSQADMVAQKLLANADRGQDRSVLSRDIIDLAMMLAHWGPVSDATWLKVRHAYGAHIDKALASSYALLQLPGYLDKCLQQMNMDAHLADQILNILRPYALTS